VYNDIKSSVQFGVQLTQDVVETINAEIVNLAALPAVLTTRVSELLLRETVQTVSRSFDHLRLTTPTTSTDKLASLSRIY